MDLFPETMGQQPEPIRYAGTLLNQWGEPRATVRLVPRWEPATGVWLCGWVCVIDNAVDELFPGRREPANYPWYRPDDVPQGRSILVAQAIAARAVKVVMEQMLAYVAVDVHGEVRELQEAIEADARRWLTA